MIHKKTAAKRSFYIQKYFAMSFLQRIFIFLSALHDQPDILPYSQHIQILNRITVRQQNIRDPSR